MMKPVAILSTDADAYHVDRTILYRNLRGLGLPVRQFLITATVDPIPVGDEVNYSAVILMYANSATATHVSYMNGDRNVPVLAWDWSTATRLKNVAGCTTGAPANGINGPAAYCHADDPNGNSIYLKNVAGDTKWYALTPGGVGIPYLPGAVGGGPAGGWENLTVCWYKQGTFFPVWYLCARPIPFAATLALRIVNVDARDHIKLFCRFDIDDYNLYGTVGGPTTLPGITEICDWARENETFILIGPQPDQMNYPWLLRATAENSDVLKAIVHDHGASGDYWRSDVPPWDTVNGKIAAEIANAAVLTALGVQTYAGGYKGHMFCPNNEATKLGLDALAQIGATTQRQLGDSPIGDNVPLTYVYSPAAGIRHMAHHRVGLNVLMVMTTTIADAWAEKGAADAEHYGYSCQSDSFMTAMLRGQRIFYCHARNCFGGPLYDNPMLNYIRLINALFRVADGRIGWVHPANETTQAMQMPTRNECY